MQELLRKCGVMEWTSADQFVDQSSSSNLSLKMGSMTPHHQNMTQLGPQFQFRDQDSSSTSQSCPEVASVGGDSLYRFPVHSGQVAFEEGSVGCIGGGQDYGFASHPDYTQPYTCNISHPYYGGLLPSYGYMPQTSIPHNFQGMNMSCARLPLPVESEKGGELVYVNAKQYYAILRRRQYRAKLDAQNKLSKSRKPYLHESRHFHALKRARGPGGRFLNRKEIKEGQHVRNLSNDHVGGSAQAIRPSTGGRMVDGTQ